MAEEYYTHRLVKSENFFKVKAIVRQARQLTRGEKTDCMCGGSFHAHQLFRCLYCGEWYCLPCAEKHFGLTRKQYEEEKRNERQTTEG